MPYFLCTFSPCCDNMSKEKICVMYCDDYGGVWMIDSALITNQGGRDNNEDYIKHVINGNSECFILCDGLGGHECGEVASQYVAETVSSMFMQTGDTPTFLKEAFETAQAGLLALQRERGMVDAMKTTLVVLVITESQIKWAHIGDSRLYHIYSDGYKYERTRDHSMVQLLCDMGEIKETEIRNHEDRNKLLRVMGTAWSKKSYDISAILERDGTHAFALMTDGFWEYVEEEDMLRLYRETANAAEWLNAMTELVIARADMTKTDNYSAICIKVD